MKPEPGLTVTLTRFDKNVANNILDFGIFKEDAALMKDLVMFFAHNFQFRMTPETLFGKSVLDPELFAKTVGRTNYRSLTNKHDDPEQLKEPRFKKLSEKELEEVKRQSLSPDGEPLFDNKLDNALYLAQYQGIRFTNKGKTPNGMTTSELSEIRFLKNVKKYYQPRTRKIYYEYEIDETFLNNLARFFLKFDFTIYRQLKTSTSKDFYIALLNLRDRFNVENQTKIRIEWSFDSLCELAQTYCDEPKERKRQINKLVEQINTLHGSNFIDLEWTANGKFSYKPVLTFYLTEKEVLEKQVESYARLNQLVVFNLKNKFRENFPMVTDPTEWKKLYIKFLKDVDWLFELKHSVFLNSYMQCFGKMPKNKKTGEDDPYDSKVLEYIRETIPTFAEQPIFNQN